MIQFRRHVLGGGTFHSLLSLFCMYTVTLRSIAVGRLVSTLPQSIDHYPFVFQSGFKGVGHAPNTSPNMRCTGVTRSVVWGSRESGPKVAWASLVRQSPNCFFLPAFQYVTVRLRTRTRFNIPLDHAVLVVRFLVIVEFHARD